jgi:replication factor C small subunit
MSNSENSLWVERYRPSGLEGYVGNEHIIQKVNIYIENNDVPHLLLHGEAGTGKTTLAKIIVNAIDCDYLYINASDERGIDTLREKIRGFAASVGFKTWKVVNI